MPYGRFSAVCIFSTTHHIPLGDFTQALYFDALANLQEYLLAAARADSTAVHQVVTQNILPSSGGALLHPHMQANADAWPMTYHRCILEKEQVVLASQRPEAIGQFRMLNSQGGLQDQRDQMTFGLMVLPDSAVGMGSGGIEIAQGYPAQIIGLAKIVEHTLES